MTFYELIDNELSHIFTQGVPSRTFYKFGDFNGDGKTDIAFAPPPLEEGPNNVWGMAYSTGSSLEIDYITIGNLSTEIGKNLIYPADLDGDGKTDLVYIWYGEHDGTELGMYVAYNKADTFMVFSSQINVSDVEAQVGDFKGNGLMEMYNSNYLHYFFPNRDHCMVQAGDVKSVMRKPVSAEQAYLPILFIHQPAE